MFFALLAFLFVASAALACEFGWTTDFNREAKADPAAFRTQLAERFDLSDIQVMALRNIFASPADAYIMLRFGEIKGGLKKISKEDAIEAIKKYRTNKGKGWVVLAQVLGVGFDSEEFLALQHGYDLLDHDHPDHFACSDYDHGTVTFAANTLNNDNKHSVGFKN
jgi:hypothetical protein